MPGRLFLDTDLFVYSFDPTGPAKARTTKQLIRHVLTSGLDSLIVAAALEGQCSTLYSEDLQHGFQIDGLRIENPFR